MINDEFESRIHSFELAWQRSGPGEIAECLQRPTPLTAEERLRVLYELVCVDLEYRWRSPRSPGPLALEDYVRAFPGFGSLDQLRLELIGEEYRVRRQWGDRPTHAEFLSRFRSRHQDIETEMRRIDTEIEAENADPPRDRLSAERSRAPETLAVLTAGDPGISHEDLLLQRMIGAGTTGKVYQAQHRSAGRAVAVKFLRKSLLRDRRVVQRFIDEARTAAGLCHPNVVAIHGLGRTNGGAFFIVMDLVTGPNLAHLGSSRSVSVEEAIAWGIQMCDALEHAHSRGVVHCDLKPANILTDDQGNVRVTDFGLARSLVAHTPGTADIEGTAPFMAPEQACRSWGDIDQRTDVYGIGAVLYTLLAGRPPFVGRGFPEIVAGVISSASVVPPERLRPDVPRTVGDLCVKCLAKVPAARFQSMREVRSALVQLAERP